MQHANHKQHHVYFNEGHLVWVVLNKDCFPSEEYKKLFARTIRSLEIIDKINSHAYQLRLPKHSNL